MKVEINKSNQIIYKNDEPIADVAIDIPSFSESKYAGRLTKYYTKVQEELTKFLKALPSPLNTPVEVRYNITHKSDTILSLYRDIYIGTNYIRIGDTWVNGYPVSLKGLGLRRKNQIKYCICEADVLNRSGYISLLQNYPKLIRKKFRPECFYIQDGYLMIFYQPGVLAGKSYGVISFKCDLLFEAEL